MISPKALLLKTLGSKESMHADITLIETEDMHRIDSALAKEKFREEFLKKLLEEDEKSKLALKVRFLGELYEFEGTSNSKDKKIKGNKIVETFFQPESAWQLSGIPQFCEQDILNYQFDSFKFVKNIFLQELVHVKTLTNMLDIA